jgi:hypothetical protein
MPQFVFAYRSPKGYKPSDESVASWMNWFDSMGDHLVELGKPVFDGNSVGECSTETTELGGYSIISAEDIETALTIAKGCPHLSRGGGVEVGLLSEVPAATNRLAG